MNSTPKFEGTVKFPISGQVALPKWQRDAIKRGMDSLDGPPESLRFTCRIAEDARQVFADLRLDDGTQLALNPKGAQPQFGKNHKGQPYLTVTLTDDKGDSYTVKWVGDAVPVAMQETAVQHDEGKKVGRKVVALDFAKATVKPVHKRSGGKHRSERDYKAEKEHRKGLREAGVEPSRRRKQRVCSRLTAEDLAAS